MSQASTRAATDGGQSLRDEIDTLSRANRAERSTEQERRILELRHDAGVELLRRPASSPEYPQPAFERLDPAATLPEVTPDELTPELLRAAILRGGALLVRGLVDRDEALRYGEEIERAMTAREAQRESEPPGDGYFEEFKAQDAYNLDSRAWVTDAGGVWAADSPRLTFEMLELFEQAGLQRLIRDYLGEPPAFSIQKCTLRKVPPTAGNGYPGWHQDGRFLGDVRALNVWLTLTHCGDEAPGLDLVPRRIDHVLPTGTEGAVFDWVVSPAVVDEARGELEVVRPIFEPGDVMLFDDLFLHSTAADPETMPNWRYAVESWFFGPSGFPGQYAPLAL